MIKGFAPLLVALILSFCLEVLGQQSIQSRCETLTAFPPRPEDNQPIPEQLKIPDAPKTARQVSCFRSFNGNSTMIDVVRKCGVPDKHMGSGVYIFVYYMTDCSTVSIGTADLQHLGISHVKQGQTTILFNECTKQQAMQAEENTDHLNNWSDVPYRRLAYSPSNPSVSGTDRPPPEKNREMEAAVHRRRSSGLWF